MPPMSSSKSGSKRKSASSSGGKGGRSSKSAKKTAASAASTNVPPSSGLLVTCDVPTKQFIKHLNDDSKSGGEEFIIEDLDATHLLIKKKARDEILRKVEEWMDSNVFTNVERVGENLETG